MKAALFGRQSTLAGFPGSVGRMVTSTRLSLTMTGVIRTLPFGTRKCSNSRSSTTTSPATDLIPDAATSACQRLQPGERVGVGEDRRAQRIRFGVVEIGEGERAVGQVAAAERQVGIGDQHEVALEHAVGRHRAGAVDGGVEAVVGAERVERQPDREQLPHRAGEERASPDRWRAPAPWRRARSRACPRSRPRSAAPRSRRGYPPAPRCRSAPRKRGEQDGAGRKAGDKGCVHWIWAPGAISRRR